MDSTLTKATTLLFLVASFCLAGIALAKDDDFHPVTTHVHSSDDSHFIPLPPPSADPPADSLFNPRPPPSVYPPADSLFSPPHPPSVDPPADSFFSPPPPASVDPPADSPVSPPPPPSVDPPADSPVSPPLPPSVDPPADSLVSPPPPASVDPPADSPVSPPPPPSVDPPADWPVSPPLPPSVDPPADSPVSPPLPPPVHPPAQPPVPRSPEQRGIVAIKGDVLCQSCKYAGSDDLTGASPINGAVVKVQCKINETVIELSGVTFGHGYFFLRKVNVNINDFDNCKAYLVWSPLARCNIPTNLHDGIIGAELKWHKPPSFGSPSYALFTVKPFAFHPKCN